MQRKYIRMAVDPRRRVAWPCQQCLLKVVNICVEQVKCLPPGSFIFGYYDPKTEWTFEWCSILTSFWKRRWPKSYVSRCRRGKRRGPASKSAYKPSRSETDILLCRNVSEKVHTQYTYVYNDSVSNSSPLDVGMSVAGTFSDVAIVLGRSSLTFSSSSPSASFEWCPSRYLKYCRCLEIALPSRSCRYDCAPGNLFCT